MIRNGEAFTSWLLFFIDIIIPTISQEKEEPPFSNESTEDNHQHEVEHDAFTQHPGEDSQEKVVQQSCYKNTGSLGLRKQCLQLTIM